MKLGVFLAIGESFKDYKIKGQDQLMINYHLKNYSQNFEKVYVFSYANENIKFFGNVIILPNKWKLHRYIYALILPFLCHKYIKNVDIIRGFQISSGIPGIISKLFFDKKFIINYGYNYVEFARIENKLFQSFLYSFLSSIIFRFSHKIIITAKYLSKLIPIRFKNKIIYIPNGVDVSKFKKLKIKKDIDILYVGRFEKQKNLLSLIKAISLLDKSELKIVFCGSGSLKSKLINQAKIYQVDLQILNSIPHNLLPNIYNRSKIFILPSFIEGQPKVLLEAMSCGVPVIASDIAAHQEIIKDRFNGILCSGNAVKIAKFIEFLNNNHKIKNKLSKAGRKTILLKYSKKLLNKQEINLLRKFSI